MANLWRRRQRRILQFMAMALNAETSQGRIRRGIKRRYNRGQGEFEIVTTRFSAAEYDSLHAAASALRVSVSWLVFRLILLWKKLRKRRRVQLYLTNYKLILHAWSSNAISYTETIEFRPTISLPP